LDEACEQQAPASAADIHHKSSKTKSLKVNLGACQIYETLWSSKGAHEHPATARSENVQQQQSHKIRPPKLNLGACQNYAAPGANSGSTQEQQAATSIGVVHKHKSRTRSAEYVDAWQTFVVDSGSSDRLHEHQEWVNGADVQLRSSTSRLHTNVAAIASSDIVHGQQTPATCAHAQEQINETMPLKLKLGACDALLLHGTFCLTWIHSVLELCGYFWPKFVESFSATVPRSSSLSSCEAGVKSFLLFLS
jgi:hypothetical protein